MATSRRSRLGALVLAGVLAAGCGGDDNGEGGMDPVTTGTVSVTVNADGSPRAGATVRLFAAGATSASATETTGTNGRATFSGVSEGSHEVEIDVPSGYELDEGETARKSVTVTAGQTASTAFDLVNDGSTTVVEITASGTSFSDADLTISPGTTVRWIAGDAMGHTVTPDGHSEWSSANLSSTGSTFEHTFNSTGDFPYYCAPHQAQGMTGIIRVE